jgi:hypothetical protein
VVGSAFGPHLVRLTDHAAWRAERRGIGRDLIGALVLEAHEHEWGLLDVDAAGNAVGAEYWHASQRLPTELLQALPAPPALAQQR